MFKKINYQAYFALSVLFFQLGTTVTAADNIIVEPRTEFMRDVKFVYQLYDKWIQHKFASLKDPINNIVQLSTSIYKTRLFPNDYPALISQGEDLENDFLEKAAQLKANMIDKGYFYSWHDKDTSWLNEGITPKEKQKFIKLTARLKPNEIALLCHLAELGYRYGIDLSQDFENFPWENIRNLDQTEFAKKVAGRNALHCMFFSHLANCKNLDVILKKDMQHLKTLILASQNNQSYAYIDILKLYVELYPDFEFSERDLLGACSNPISKMDVFAHLI